MAIDTAPGRLSRNNEEPISIAVIAKIQASFRAYGEIFKRHPAAPLGHNPDIAKNGRKIRASAIVHTATTHQAADNHRPPRLNDAYFRTALFQSRSGCRRP